jgi:hypothetical protein
LDISYFVLAFKVEGKLQDIWRMSRGTFLSIDGFLNVGGDASRLRSRHSDGQASDFQSHLGDRPNCCPQLSKFNIVYASIIETVATPSRRFTQKQQSKKSI